MAKKIVMVAKTMEKPTKKKSEKRKMTDEEMEELSNSLVVAINNKYSSIKQVFGEDVLKSLSIAVVVFFMHQAELTTAETHRDKEVLFEALIENFTKRVNLLKKELLEGGAWPN